VLPLLTNPAGSSTILYGVVGTNSTEQKLASALALFLNPHEGADDFRNPHGSGILLQEIELMNSNQKGARPKFFKGMRVYTPARAVETLPYVTHVVRSLREHALEMRQQRAVVRRLAASSRQDRDTLIAHQEAVAAVDRAQHRYEETLEELKALDVWCQNALDGVVLFPFAKGKQLAWFIFDLHEETPLQSWRFHSDPEDTRRPVSELSSVKSS
jgi:hypothetical protein